MYFTQRFFITILGLCYLTQIGGQERPPPPAPAHGPPRRDGDTREGEASEAAAGGSDMAAGSQDATTEPLAVEAPAMADSPASAQSNGHPPAPPTGDSMHPGEHIPTPDPSQED